MLSTQDAERYMKMCLPFFASKDPSISTALSRHDKLKKRTFGELIGVFVDSSTSDSDDFADHLAALVEQRNKIVHHFNETYAQKLRSGGSQDVVKALGVQLKNVNTFRDLLAQIVLHLFEAIKDTVFQGNPEYHDMADLCAEFRRHVVS